MNYYIDELEGEFAGDFGVFAVETNGHCYFYGSEGDCQKWIDAKENPTK